MQDKKAVLDKITKEYNDLEAKLLKLTGFTWSDDYDNLSPVLKELLYEQHDAMLKYGLTLMDRIKYLNGELSEELVEYYKDKYDLNQKGESFEYALKALKQGHPVSRSGWNGKGIFITLKKGDIETPNNNFNEVMTHDFIYIDTTGLRTDNPDTPKDRVPWTPSQTDLLAHDWRIYLD